MKLKVLQKELVCNLRYVRICDYVYSYTEQLDNGKKCEIIINHNIINDIQNDNRNCLIVYSKNDNQLLTFFNLISNIKKIFILVTGCSDNSITHYLYHKKPDNIVKWYAENVEHNADDLIPLPMGSLSTTWIGNNKFESEIYNHTKFKLVLTNNKEPEIRNLVFMCFSLGTNSHHRTQVYNYFDNKKNCINFSLIQIKKFEEKFFKRLIKPKN